MALLKIAFSVPYMALQVKGAGIILNIVSDNSISVWVGSLLTYSIVVVYRLCNCEWSGGIAEMFTNIAGGNCRILLPASHSAGCHGLPWRRDRKRCLSAFIGIKTFPHT